MKLEKKVEEKLLAYIKEIFANDSWTLAHSLSAVGIIKQIAKSEGADEKILATTMYLHDIGYGGLLADGYSFSQRIAAKKEHMPKGAKMARDFLGRIGGYTEEEISQIAHLIEVHDNVDALKTQDELLVLEADSLASIDPKVPFSFSEEDVVKYVDFFLNHRATRFVSKKGKELLEKFSTQNKVFAGMAGKFKK
ncbi:HD domain protein [uncultured archaeon]|nr:HD domain protein [uncultured archaeon]